MSIIKRYRIMAHQTPRIPIPIGAAKVNVRSRAPRRPFFAAWTLMDPNGNKDGAGQRLDAAQQLATTNICLQVAGRNETDRFGRGMRLFFWNFLLN
jgi:hypothetical protein